jgi:diguanylate cyclase (GGDEF)-like protein
MNTPAARPAAWGLGTRFVVLFLALLLAIQIASFATIRSSIAANARASITAELEVGERALQRLLAQSGSRLADASRLLAADYGFRAAVASGDLETIASALENHGARIDASVAALLDTGFALRVASGPGEDRLRTLIGPLAAAARRGGGDAAAVIAVVDGAPTQFVLVPLRAPLTVGWVLMGSRLDRHLAGDLRSVSALDVALRVREGDAPWRSVVSTLPTEAAGALDGTARGDGTALLGEAEYGSRALGLASVGPVQVQALLLRSVDDAVRPYRQLQWLLAAITGAGVLAFAIGATITARRITEPVRRLVDAAGRLGAGDLQTPVRGVRRRDEIGNLAQAFEGMRHNLAGQQAALERLAFWDPLTTLPNRTQFDNAVRAAIARADPQHDRLTVIMLDLDRFKHVNDVLGYAFGDRLLQAVAQRLADGVRREGDLLARLSGDEFALLLGRGGLADALAVAQRIGAALEQPLTLDDHMVDLSAGIGVACWPEHAEEAGALLSRAEIAMYAAKRRGDGPMVYDPRSDTGSAETLSLLSELRRAVDADELRLFLQPKIALADGRLVGAEALVRWQHPERGMVPPMQFIPFAEQTGFIRQLTLWMFGAAAHEWPRLERSLGTGLRLSVNLSTRDLLDQELPDKLGAILDRHAAPAAAFCLEITESAIMDDPQRAEATLRRLAERGFGLSIDDFGTGYSSLAYLKRLPVHELKIDKSFVMGMERDAGDAKIVRSTIDLAHNLGLRVVAEGVENAAIWNQLHRLDCDEAQGYHMSRPLPAAEFAAWGARWSDRAASGWAGLELQ